MIDNTDLMTELRELRERAQGAQADLRVIAEQLEQALRRNRELETQLQEMTNHRNRLLGEKEIFWAKVCAPDLDPARLAVPAADGCTTDEGPEA